MFLNYSTDSKKILATFSHSDLNISSPLQIIEKRRRDRINNSLSELRRLVPAAFEKQVIFHVTLHGEIIVLIDVERLMPMALDLNQELTNVFFLQGSAKLEKAEILQMTVDHLRILHSKGKKIYKSYELYFTFIFM